VRASRCLGEKAERPQTDAMKLHLNEQVSKYGATSLVNLINHKGHEKPIKEMYEKYMSQVGGLVMSVA
jgi:hypothetical protein